MSRGDDPAKHSADAGSDLGATPRTGTAVVRAPDSWGPLTKDFLVFEGKLVLDGLLDLVLAPLAALAFAIDFMSGDRSGRRFNRLLRSGRRLDHWLRLYRPSTRAGPPKETLTEAGMASADQLIAKIEGMVRDKELPDNYRERLRTLADRARVRPPERPMRPGNPRSDADEGEPG